MFQDFQSSEWQIASTSENPVIPSSDDSNGDEVSTDDSDDSLQSVDDSDMEGKYRLSLIG